jgi:hypothetical protein
LNKKYEFIVSISHEKEFAVGVVIAFRKWIIFVILIKLKLIFMVI